MWLITRRRLVTPKLFCYAGCRIMSYVVLARKWRPQQFDDLVGQEHVARTLSNAINSNRVAHAFLFTGVRGVGKTTSARLLARALNCLGPNYGSAGAQDPGPTPTPCLTCAACREITAGTDVDVREIDGASYTGVDDVRKLQEALPYRPARDRFKIFIIDEVHMLSQNAWNAFLKTLEEPPPHVKFIFATTEVHKVPVTILSRVQRFDFKLIPARLIAQRLETVLKAEGIQCDETALSIIAREAAGSMRDAMSLLDQVIAWRPDGLDGESVALVLGIASRKVLHDLGRALVSHDAEQCLRIIHQLANQGFDLSHVARDFLGLLRDLVVGKACEKPDDLLDLADTEKNDVIALASDTNLDDLVRLHQGFSSGFDDVVRSGQPRSALEMLLVRLASRPPLLPLDELLNRLGALEHRFLAAASRGGPQRGLPPPRPTASDRAINNSAPARGRPREAATPAARRPPSKDADRDEEPPAKGSPSADGLAPQPVVIEKPSSETSEQDLLSAWQELVDKIAEQRPEVAAILEHAVPLHVTPTSICIAWPPGSTLDKQFADTEFTQLLTAAHATPGSVVHVEILHDHREAQGRATLAAVETANRTRRARELVQQSKRDPCILQAIEILGAHVKDVRVPQDLK
jgi:DNA polymerase-3 subunit gamma/tau